MPTSEEETGEIVEVISHIANEHHFAVLLQQISSSGHHPLPLEHHGLVDQIS